jgi:hypothetical protein
MDNRDQPQPPQRGRRFDTLLEIVRMILEIIQGR